MRQPAKIVASVFHGKFIIRLAFTSSDFLFAQKRSTQQQQKNAESINYVEFRFRSNLAVVWWCDWFKTSVFCASKHSVCQFSVHLGIVRSGLVDIIFRFSIGLLPNRKVFGNYNQSSFPHPLNIWPATKMYGRMSSANFVHIIFISCTLFFVATGQRNHVRITFIVAENKKSEWFDHFLNTFFNSWIVPKET